MKKQIFSLLFSAAIFTTSPLFAMDPSLGNECGEEADSFRAAFLSKAKQQIVEISMEELKHMTSQREHSPSSGVLKLSVYPIEIVSYQFFTGKQRYELHAWTPKYWARLKSETPLEKDQKRQLDVLLNKFSSLNETELSTLQQYLNFYKNPHPQDSLQALIKKNESVEFLRDQGAAHYCWDMMSSLPVAFYYKAPDFHMTIRTKY